jgi:arylsulfatase A-like enzyme
VLLEEPGQAVHHPFLFAVGMARLRVRLHVEDGPVALAVTVDGAKVSEQVLEAGPWTVLEVPLEAALGQRRVGLRLEDAPEEENRDRGKVALLWMELLSCADPGVLVRTEFPDPLEIRLRAELPRREERLALSGDGPRRVSLLGLGGPLHLFADPAGPPLRWRATPRDAWTSLPAAGITVRSEPGPLSLELEGGPATLRVVRPRAELAAEAGEETWRLVDELALGEAAASTGVAEPILEAVTARIAVRGDRRMAFWLPTDSAVETKVVLAAGDRVRYAAGIPDRRARTLAGLLAEDEEIGHDPAPESRQASFRVTWTAEGRPPVELDHVVGMTDAEPWREREIEIGVSQAGPGVLRFETACAGGGEEVSAAFGDPRVIRAGSSGVRRPNLLVYLIDTLRADHLSCYGARNPTSPNLDRLAAEGFRFERFRAVAPWTRPTTATVLTGYYPSWHGAGKELPLPESLVTLAESLRAAGYSTWAAVTNVQVSAREIGFDQGFHRFLGQEAMQAPDPVSAPHSRTLHAAIRPWLEKAAGEPFFLYLHSMDPHSPYAPPAAAARPFGRGYSGIFADVPLRPFMLRRLKDQVEEQDLRYVEDVYDDEIEDQDAQIGSLLETLDELRILDDTVVIVLSDHGEEFLEHGDWNHGYRMWEELLRVPLIVWVPERWREAWQLRPRVVEAPVSQADFVPGVLDLLGVEDDFPRQGRSFFPLLRGESGESRVLYGEDYQTWEGDEIGALVSGRYKLIWTLDRDPPDVRYRLFDLEADPGEQVDLAGARPDLVESLAGLREQVRGELASVRDRLDAAGLSEVVPAEGGAGSKVELPPEEVRLLEALGYVGTDRK